MANRDLPTDADIARVLEAKGPFRASERLEVYRLSYGATIGKPDPFGFDVTWFADVPRLGFQVVAVAGGYELQRVAP